MRLATEGGVRGAGTRSIGEAPLSHGDVFAGRYQVVRSIARGSMGVVYEVEDRETRVRHALKVLSPRFLSSAEVRRRFELEAKLPARIDSVHVAEVLDACTEGPDAPFIVMELLRGCDLASHLEEHGPLSAAETVECLAQVSSVLEQTHALGIVHRDLKPANLFLTRTETGAICLKVLDFGIAKDTTSATSQTQSILGSAHFIAPEQIRYKRVPVGARADIYAMGHLAYCMLTGEPYWLPEDEASDSLMHLMMDVAFGATEAASVRARARRGIELPAAFDTWFARATALDPEDRFESASVAVAKLAGVLDAAPPLVKAAPARARVAPRSSQHGRSRERRSRILWWMPLPLAAAALAGWVFWPSTPTETTTEVAPAADLPAHGPDVSPPQQELSPAPPQVAIPVVTSAPDTSVRRVPARSRARQVPSVEPPPATSSSAPPPPASGWRPPVFER